MAKKVDESIGGQYSFCDQPLSVSVSCVLRPCNDLPLKADVYYPFWDRNGVR